MNTPATITDPEAIAQRQNADSRLYDFIRNGQNAQAAADDATRPRDITERMREIGSRPRRPPMTPKLAEQLQKLADEIRPRAKAKSGLYGLRPSIAADVRRAIEWIDDNAEHYRRHK